MDPRNWTFTQWINFCAFALAGAAAGSWWADFLTQQQTAVVHAVILYIVALLNFMVSGKAPDPAAAPKA